MADNKSWDRHFPIISVAKTGRTLSLAKGQFAVVDMDAKPTKDGLKIIDSAAGLSQNHRIQLRLGKAPIGVTRSQDNKSWESVVFKLKEITKVKVDAPKQGIELDEMIVGYDGFNEDTALSFKNGDNDILDICLYGEAIEMLGYKEGKVDAKVYFDVPVEGDKGTDWTDQEVVEKAVEQFKRITLVGGVPITQYLDITTTDSTKAPLTGTEKVFWRLTVDDRGDYSSLGRIQSQYPDYVIKKDVENCDGCGETVYVTILDTGVTPDDYIKRKPWKIKGCDDCPTGYSELTGGMVYSVYIEDDGADSTATVEGISANVVAGSAVKLGQKEGFSEYSVVVDSPGITDEELDTFVESNPGSVVELVAQDVADICQPDTEDTIAWVQGESCYASEETYTIVVPDDKCGNNKLAEIQAAYPDLTITAGTSAYCQTEYTTTVATDIVCEECSDAFTELFVSEAPDDFEFHSWKKEPKTYNPAALMGIKIKAKPTILAGSEEFRDDMPFIASAPRFVVSGGYVHGVSESYTQGSGRFAVTVLSVGSEPENWGGDLRPFEDSAQMYFDMTSRHKGNNYGKYILGEETSLKATCPYVDYAITVRNYKMSQAVSGELFETITYHLLVEPGFHQDVEDIVNAFAAAAGVNGVQAYGKIEPTT